MTYIANTHTGLIAILHVNMVQMVAPEIFRLAFILNFDHLLGTCLNFSVSHHVFPLISYQSFHQQGHAGSKTLHQQNPRVLNWRCQLTQVDLYNGRKTVVAVVLISLIALYLLHLLSLHFGFQTFPLKYRVCGFLFSVVVQKHKLGEVEKECCIDY